MKQILKTELQLLNEETYCRKHIDTYIWQEIAESDDMQAKIELGVSYLNQWLGGEYYPAKMKRLAQVKRLNLTKLVTQIFVGIAYCQVPELFTSVSSQLASRLKFSTKEDGITTIAEIIAVLCHTDAFDIIKPSREASLVVQSRIPLSKGLLYKVSKSAFLPPMVCLPALLKHNYESAYLTIKESVLLGAGNHHEGDLCLDTLNMKNAVPLKLDTQFLSTVEETPRKPLDTVEKQQNWARFKQNSYHFYELMVKQGNRFYLTHKRDKRGRTYAQGYHINPQGSAFKKAMIELAEEELVDGVPL